MSDIKISFTGDLSLTGIYYDKVINNQEIFDKFLLYNLRNTDYCVCNFEGPATHNMTGQVKTPLKSPYNSIKYLSQRSINIFNLANNHIFDYGETGVKDTTNEIIKNQMHFFGTGKNIEEVTKPLYIKKNDIVIAIIGMTEYMNNKGISYKTRIFNNKNLSCLKKVIYSAAHNADWVIINYHGGEEYTLFPSPVKRRLLKSLAKLKNVDIIITHHSHTFQGIEKFNNTTIFYSLGNFIFDIQTHDYYDYTHESAIINFTFFKKNYMYKLIPIKINKTLGIVEKGGLNFTKHINQLSDFSQYKYKWRRDAYRRIFKQKNINADSSHQKERLFRQSVFKWIIKPSFYKNFFRILFNKNSRSLYVQAVIYKLLRKYHV